ncbi:hypothetical protein [Candidatus Enterococcus murrayae]|uniref:Uncharacterized protein n=1 Tax=Candidatus Enterococcus murrayae TaxID=2815321 RepID=A0ABS3HD37_9ENTE|nr:hypothetical protein [Enterococcus sp. MJM16]MBO0451361.1 hypothetical protein [Enterococcus sp. MJM16]
MGEIPTLSLLSTVLVTVAISYFVAWFYRNHYNPQKMLIAYLVYALPLSILGYFLHLNFILIVGIYLFGGIILIFRNSTYFNQ